MASQYVSTLPTFNYDTRLDLNLCEAMASAAAPVSAPNGLELDFARNMINWHRTSRTVPVKNAVSAAELCWLDEDGRATCIRVYHGPFHVEWPSALSKVLCLVVSPDDFARAEQSSGGAFTFALHTSYLARLFFIQHAPKVDTKVHTEAETRPLPDHAALALLFPSHPPLRMWTTTHLLHASSPYFENLFSSEFSEAAKRTLVEYEELSASERSAKRVKTAEPVEDDSDNETDDFYQSSLASPSSSPPPDLRYHQISICDASYTTYRAVLCWLQTGYYPFATLSSALPPSSDDSLPPKQTYLAEWAKKHPHLPLPSSPTSTYALSHFLDLPDLSSLALENLRSQLTPANIAIELFSDFANKYEEPRRVLVDFALKRWDEVVQSEAFKAVLEKLRRNELAAGPVMAELVPYILKSA
ncbi:hypothetical protein JCM10213v2_005910 [Rhodosporidiobolus nylandii]